MVKNTPQGELLVFFRCCFLPQPAVVSLSHLILLFFFCHLHPLPLPLTYLFLILLPSSIVFSVVSSFSSYAAFLHHCQLFGWHPLSTFPLLPSILLPYSFATFFGHLLFFFLHCLLFLPPSVPSSVVFYCTPSTALFLLLFLFFQHHLLTCSSATLFHSVLHPLLLVFYCFHLPFPSFATLFHCNSSLFFYCQYPFFSWSIQTSDLLYPWLQKPRDQPWVSLSAFCKRVC